MCLSKGLGAPAGTLLLGRAEFIDAARRWRKALGGGMRQAGVLAAAGIYALEHHVARLAEDHDNAARLAEGLRALGLDAPAPQTNILYVAIPKAHVAPLRARLAAAGILVTVAERTRMVTHLQVSRAGVAAPLQELGGFFGAV